MKYKFIMLTAVLFLFFSAQVNAQLQEETYVKIIPTAEADVIKVLYALEVNETLEVKFTNREGETKVDQISGSYPKGISKKYNIKAIGNHDFWIEVTSQRVAVTYHMVPAKNKKIFIPHLEKTIYNHPVVASK
jgi:hypothetical protein